jgi:hypothetical protein
MMNYHKLDFHWFQQVYQLAEDVKQYAEIESVRSEGKANRRSELYEHQKLKRETQYVSKCKDRLKQFMIIIDHDRINNVPRIKYQEGYQMKI